MNAYSIALFLHIVGALGIFAALGLEWTGLWQIRSAMTPQQVGGWMRILKSVRKFGFVSMLVAVVTGIYMMTVWGGAVWITVTVGSLVLIMSLAQMVTAPRIMAIGRALATEKMPLSQTFYLLANHPLLLISIQIRVAIALGIVFLKIAQPDWGGSLVTIGIATVLGAASALPMFHRERTQAPSAN